MPPRRKKDAAAEAAAQAAAEAANHRRYLSITKRALSSGGVPHLSREEAFKRLTQLQNGGDKAQHNHATSDLVTCECAYKVQLSASGKCVPHDTFRQELTRVLLAKISEPAE